MAKPNKKYKVIWRGKPLRIAVSVQTRYTRPIHALVKQMTDETDAKLTALFNAEFSRAHFEHVNAPVGTMDASISSQARIILNALKKRYDQLFGKLAMGLSPQMATDVDRNSFATVSGSVSDAPNLKSEGAKLTIDLKSLDQSTLQILRGATNRSSNFITSIPESHLNAVGNAVFDSITNGNGLQDLIPFLEKQDNHITNWARNTAMDQTRKAYNGLNAGRLRKIGISKGEWIHTGGSQHPREEHEDFDGKVFDLNVGAPIGDEGQDVLPGDDPNCRCTFAPVIVFDDDDKETDDAE